MADTIALSMAELRAVTAFAIACARPALAIFERARPRDRRPHAAIEAAKAFANGGPRTKAIRDGAWGAHRAAQETRKAKQLAASEAARAAGHAAGAAYLHPLAKATQVLHILGSAATAARAFELAANDDPAVGDRHMRRAAKRATPAVLRVLRRFPAAPPGGRRVGEIVRALDECLRPGVTSTLQRSTPTRRRRA